MATFSHLSTTYFGLVAPSVPSQSLSAPISLAPSEVEVTEEITNVPETKTTILEGEFDVMESEHDSIHFSATETNEEMSFREGSSSNSNRQDRPNTPLDSLNIESAVPPPTHSLPTMPYLQSTPMIMSQNPSRNEHITERVP
jgi:hypothetical protein